MNYETLLLQRIDHQNDIINLLQKENASLGQIIKTYLLESVAASDSELAHIKALVQKSYFNTSSVAGSEGSSGSQTFLRSSNEGRSGNNSVHRNSDEGRIGENSFLRTGSDGSNGKYIAVVAARLRPFMKNAAHQSLVNTALILCHLQNNPATPLPTLRKLTGMSKDGMFKRIMALKNVGLIVRLSKPLRFALTEKAQGLLEEHP